MAIKQKGDFMEKNFLNMYPQPNKPMFHNQKKYICPFCDKQNVSETLINTNQFSSWIKNKYPLLLDDTYQTLIIETPNCEANILNYSKEELEKIFSFTFECYNQLKNNKKYNDVLLFKNHGILSGGSIPHAHIQLVGMFENKVEYKKIINSTLGENVFENEEVKITISNFPISEFFEFNLILKNKNKTSSSVSFLQEIIRYSLSMLDSRFNDFNFAYYEINGLSFFKVVPRSYASPYLIMYDLKQVPVIKKNISKELNNWISKKFNKEVFLLEKNNEQRNNEFLKTQKKWEEIILSQQEELQTLQEENMEFRNSFSKLYPVNPEEIINVCDILIQSQKNSKDKEDNVITTIGEFLLDIADLKNKKII